MSTTTSTSSNGIPLIGVDVGGTKIEAVALSPSGEVIDRRRVLTPQGDYDGTVAAIAALVAEAATFVKHEAGTVVSSVGVGVPGTISPATGLMKNANSVCLIGRPLDSDLARATGLTVCMANDANCFTQSEAVDGAGAGADVVFGVILGTGVGGGVAVHERVLTGPNAIAGEWGHNPLPWPEDHERPGPACYCGRHGCIEAFLSGPAIERTYANLAGDTIDVATIAERASAGETTATDVLERAIDQLARALATIINVIDPDVIVLGGGLSNLDMWYERVPEAWTQYVFSDTVTTRLTRNVHGDSSGVRGAAWLTRSG